MSTARGAAGRLPSSDWPSALEATGRPHTAMSQHSSGFIELPSRDGTRTERVGNYILGDSLGTGSFGARVPRPTGLRRSGSREGAAKGHGRAGDHANIG